MGRPRLNLAGKTFGRLTVLKEVGQKHNHVLWCCKCVCGSKQVVRSDSLRSGNTRSCCCIQTETRRVHGHRTRSETSLTYRAWQNMLARCTTVTHKSYPTYGGANPPVTVCRRWLSFEHFLADLGEKPSPQHSLGRFCDLTNYDSEGCGWMTMQEQKLAQRNKRALLKWRNANVNQQFDLQAAA